MSGVGVIARGLVCFGCASCGCKGCSSVLLLLG